MNRIYLKHYTRGDEICPLCQSALRWRRTGSRQWTPCNYEPVVFCFDPGSRERVVYRGEITAGVRILRKDNAAFFVGKQTFSGLEPHAFTCAARNRLTAFREYRKD